MRLMLSSAKQVKSPSFSTNRPRSSIVDFITSQVFSKPTKTLSIASQLNKLNEYVGFANKRSFGMIPKFSGYQKTISPCFHYLRSHCIGDYDGRFRSRSPKRKALLLITVTGLI